LTTYQDLIPSPDSPNLKFMRNIARRKKQDIGYKGKNGNMGYKSVIQVYKELGELLSPPMKLTPGTGRTTGITLMSRVGLSDSFIALTSGHDDPKVLRKSYLQAGVEEKMLGSRGLSFSRQQVQKEKENDFLLPGPVFSPTLGLDMLSDAVSAPLALAGPIMPPPSLPVAQLEEFDEEVDPTPPPKPRRRNRPNFSVGRNRFPNKRSSNKENEGPGELPFSLSQPLPVARMPRSISLSDLTGRLQPLPTYNTNLDIFNSNFPPSPMFNQGPLTEVRPMKTNNMNGTFNNCTFVLGKE
jgi:hypothetical protein